MEILHSSKLCSTPIADFSVSINVGISKLTIFKNNKMLRCLLQIQTKIYHFLNWWFWNFGPPTRQGPPALRGLRGR